MLAVVVSLLAAEYRQPTKFLCVVNKLLNAIAFMTTFSKVHISMILCQLSRFGLNIEIHKIVHV